METTRTSTIIERPAPQVFDFVTEFPNDPKWQRGKESCTWTSTGGLRVGATYEQRARFLGKEIVNNFTVLELDPGRRVVYESRDGSFPLVVTRTVEDLGDGRCRFTEAVEGEASGFFKLASPLLQPLVRSSIRKDFRVLKALLEEPAANA
ncbi:MAG: SRPBCC family protein [Actinomycetota bacterium]